MPPETDPEPSLDEFRERQQIRRAAGRQSDEFAREDFAVTDDGGVRLTEAAQADQRQAQRQAAIEDFLSRTLDNGQTVGEVFGREDVTFAERERDGQTVTVPALKDSAVAEQQQSAAEQSTSSEPSTTQPSQPGGDGRTRDEIIADLEEDLEQRVGDNLQQGEDFVIEEAQTDDGVQLSAQLTDEFKQQQRDSARERAFDQFVDRAGERLSRAGVEGVSAAELIDRSEVQFAEQEGRVVAEPTKQLDSELEELETEGLRDQAFADLQAETEQRLSPSDVDVETSGDRVSVQLSDELAREREAQRVEAAAADTAQELGVPLQEVDVAEDFRVNRSDSGLSVEPTERFLRETAASRSEQFGPDDFRLDPAADQVVPTDDAQAREAVEAVRAEAAVESDAVVNLLNEGELTSDQITRAATESVAELSEEAEEQLAAESPVSRDEVSVDETIRGGGEIGEAAIEGDLTGAELQSIVQADDATELPADIREEVPASALQTTFDANLTDAGKRVAAAERFEDTYDATVTASDINLTDQGPQVDQQTQRAEAAIDFDETRATTITSDDVVETDEGFTLTDEARRDEAATTDFPGFRPGELEIDEETDTISPTDQAQREFGASLLADEVEGEVAPDDVVLNEDGQARLSDGRIEEATFGDALPETVQTAAGAGEATDFVQARRAIATEGGDLVREGLVTPDQFDRAQDQGLNTLPGDVVERLAAESDVADDEIRFVERGDTTFATTPADMTAGFGDGPNAVRVGDAPTEPQRTPAVDAIEEVMARQTLADRGVENPGEAFDAREARGRSIQSLLRRSNLDAQDVVLEQTEDGLVATVAGDVAGVDASRETLTTAVDGNVAAPDSVEQGESFQLPSQQVGGREPTVTVPGPTGDSPAAQAASQIEQQIIDREIAAGANAGDLRDFDLGVEDVVQTGEREFGLSPQGERTVAAEQIETDLDIAVAPSEVAPTEGGEFGLTDQKRRAVASQLLSLNNPITIGPGDVVFDEETGEAQFDAEARRRNARLTLLESLSDDARDRIIAEPGVDVSDQADVAPGAVDFKLSDVEFGDPVRDDAGDIVGFRGRLDEAAIEREARDYIFRSGLFPADERGDIRGIDFGGGFASPELPDDPDGDQADAPPTVDAALDARDGDNPGGLTDEEFESLSAAEQGILRGTVPETDAADASDVIGSLAIEQRTGADVTATQVDASPTGDGGITITADAGVLGDEPGATADAVPDQPIELTGVGPPEPRGGFAMAPEPDEPAVGTAIRPFAGPLGQGESPVEGAADATTFDPDAGEEPAPPASVPTFGGDVAAVGTGGDSDAETAPVGQIALGPVDSVAFAAGQAAAGVGQTASQAASDVASGEIPLAADASLSDRLRGSAAPTRSTAAPGGPVDVTAEAGPDPDLQAQLSGSLAPSAGQTDTPDADVGLPVTSRPDLQRQLTGSRAPSAGQTDVADSNITVRTPVEPGSRDVAAAGESRTTVGDAQVEQSPVVTRTNQTGALADVGGQIREDLETVTGPPGEFESTLRDAAADRTRPFGTLTSEFREQAGPPVADVGGDVADLIVSTQPQPRGSFGVDPAPVDREELETDVADLTRPPDEEVGEETPIESLSGGFVRGATVNTAALAAAFPESARQLGETLVDATGFTANTLIEEGPVQGTETVVETGQEVGGAVVNRAIESAQENPGQVTGSLVGTAALTAGAGAISSGAGRGAAVLIQPGEELASAAGTRVLGASRFTRPILDNRIMRGRLDQEEPPLRAASVLAGRIADTGRVVRDVARGDADTGRVVGGLVRGDARLNPAKRVVESDQLRGPTGTVSTEVGAAVDTEQPAGSGGVPTEPAVPETQLVAEGIVQDDPRVIGLAAEGGEGGQFASPAGRSPEGETVLSEQAEGGGGISLPAVEVRQEAGTEGESATAGPRDRGEDTRTVDEQPAVPREDPVGGDPVEVTGVPEDTVTVGTESAAESEPATADSDSLPLREQISEAGGVRAFVRGEERSGPVISREEVREFLPDDTRAQTRPGGPLGAVASEIAAEPETESDLAPPGQRSVEIGDPEVGDLGSEITSRQRAQREALTGRGITTEFETEPGREPTRTDAEQLLETEPETTTEPRVGPRVETGFGDAAGAAATPELDVGGPAVSAEAGGGLLSGTLTGTRAAEPVQAPVARTRGTGEAAPAGDQRGAAEQAASERDAAPATEPTVEDPEPVEPVEPAVPEPVEPSVGFPSEFDFGEGRAPLTFEGRVQGPERRRREAETPSLDQEQEQPQRFETAAPLVGEQPGLADRPDILPRARPRVGQTLNQDFRTGLSLETELGREFEFEAEGETELTAETEGDPGRDPFSETEFEGFEFEGETETEGRAEIEGRQRTTVDPFTIQRGQPDPDSGGQGLDDPLTPGWLNESIAAIAGVSRETPSQETLESEPFTAEATATLPVEGQDTEAFQAAADLFSAEGVGVDVLGSDGKEADSSGRGLL